MKKRVVRLASDPRLALMLAIFLTGVVLVGRSWSRLRHAEVWAEDGWFLTEGLSLGLKSLVTPLSGYFMTLERLAALLITHFAPPSYWPKLLVVSYYIYFLAIVPQIARPLYRWLIPSDAARVGCAALIPLTPGISEMAGSLCNSNWLMYIGLGLIALRDPAKSFTRLHYWMIFLLSASVGTSMLLVPLYLWRIFTVRRLRNGWAGARSEVIGLLILLIPIGLNALVHHQSGPLLVPNWRLVFPDYFRFIVWSVFFQPWIGDNWTVAFTSALSPPLIKWSFRVVLVGGSLFWLRRNWKQKWVPGITLFVAGTLVWLPLLWLARPEGNGDSNMAFLTPPGFWYHRYSFAGIAVSVFAWFSVLHSKSLWEKGKPTLTLVFIVLNFFFAWHRFHIFPYGSESRWAKHSADLVSSLKTGCPSSVRIAGYPDGWGFAYQTPLPIHCESANNVK